MTIPTDYIRQFAHASLKTLGAASTLLEMYEQDDQEGLHSASVRKNMAQSFSALSQAVKDLRLLAICESPALIDWKELDWASLVENQLSSSLPVTLECNTENASGEGYGDLLKAGLSNLFWFARMFSKAPTVVKLSRVEDSQGARVNLYWKFPVDTVLNRNFSAEIPFQPLDENTSHALSKTTGLALLAVKQVAEIHRGKFNASWAEDGAFFEWNCPLRKRSR